MCCTLDHEGGTLYLRCARQYLQLYDSTYPVDDISYSIHLETPAKCLARMKVEYHSHGFHHIVRWNPSAQIPTTYINLKAAKLEDAGRPIKDCSRQGHARLMNIIGRAQLHVLS